MIRSLKKPSRLCSAFFILIVVMLLNQGVEAAVVCYGTDFFDSVTRAEVSGMGAGSDVPVSIAATQQASLINQKVDLNIQLDVDAMTNGQVIAESNAEVWRLQAENKDKLTGFIVADYQFSSVQGSGKICSSNNSCMDIVDVQTQVVYNRKANGRIISATGYLTLTLDLSQASEAGDYQAILSVTLHHNNAANPPLC